MNIGHYFSLYTRRRHTTWKEKTARRKRQHDMIMSCVDGQVFPVSGAKSAPPPLNGWLYILSLEFSLNVCPIFKKTFVIWKKRKNPGGKKNKIYTRTNRIANYIEPISVETIAAWRVIWLIYAVCIEPRRHQPHSGSPLRRFFFQQVLIARSKDHGELLLMAFPRLAITRSRGLAGLYSGSCI